MPATPHKDVHILISRTREYVTCQGKKDFADVIKLRIVRRMEGYLEYLSAFNKITKVFIGGRQVGQSI